MLESNNNLAPNQAELNHSTALLLVLQVVLIALGKWSILGCERPKRLGARCYDMQRLGCSEIEVYGTNSTMSELKNIAPFR